MGVGLHYWPVEAKKCLMIRQFLPAGRQGDLSGAWDLVRVISF